jgi:hypothetical protein
MANDTRKVSELSITTTLTANDRVVVFTNPNTGTANVKTIALSNFGAGLVNNFPTANSTQYGVVKVGNNINVDANGVISSVGLPSTNADLIGYTLTTNSTGGPEWADVKTHKAKKVKHKDGSYDPEVDATVLQDTMTFVDGTGIVMVSNSVNQTIQINAQKNIRDAGAVNSTVIDFAVDEIVLIQPNNDATLTLNNYSIGKVVEVWMAATASKNLTVSNVTPSYILGGSATVAFSSGALTKLTYLSTTAANTGVYVDVNK